MASTRQDGMESVCFNEYFKNLAFALKLAWQHAPVLVFVNSVIIAVRAVIPALFILCVRGLVNGFRDSSELADNAHWLIMLPVLLLIRSLLESFTRYIHLRLRDELSVAINVEFLEHSATLDLAFFENSAALNMMNRANQDSVKFCEGLVNDTAFFVRDVVQFLVLAGIILLLSSWWLGLALLAMFLPYGIVKLRITLTRYWLQHRRSEKIRWTRYYNSKMTNHLMIPEIRVFNLAPLFIKRYRDFVESFRDENHGVQKKFLAIDLLLSVAFALVFGLLGYQLLSDVIRGTTSAGNVIAILLATERLTGTIRGTFNVVSNSIHNSLMVANVREYRSSKSQLTLPDKIEPALPIRGGVEFENVSFSYPGTEKKVLDDISFKIEPGEVVALVGRNGAGKSTIVKLLARLYLADGGAVKLDGHSVDQLSDELLYSSMAFAMQSFGRYEATVAENIAFGNWENLISDPEAIREVAKRIGLDAMIQKLPDGYDTRLGRMFGDVTLSGGQWQSLAIARAMASDAQLIVLDEPTANLDPHKEYEMFCRFCELIHEKTALIISHRFSTVRMADRILVIDEGRIAESGTHDQLLAIGGIYSQMYEYSSRMRQIRHPI